ncbi:MAG: ABC transporter ATP-binding protein [Anaerovoracaceae bacterium]|jgi:putative ABC transport system ATP-binding protein
MLNIDKISKTFAKGTINEKVALDNLSLHMKKGEFITIIGSNGAGKSTLMNCICGAIGIDSGTITLDGINLTKLPEYKRSRYIGRVFQDPLKGTAFDMTIEENLAIASSKNKSLGLQRGLNKENMAYFREQLALLDMGLEDRMKQKAKSLSGGQRQALTLFMAVISKPKLLLLDEHIAALDPGAAKKVLTLTDEYANSQDMCTLMITHNMKHALEHGNRTILMKDGKIALDISGEERENMTIEKLINQFEIDNDRMLL